MLETIEVDTNMAMNMNNSKEIATYREIGDAVEMEGNCLFINGENCALKLNC